MYRTIKATADSYVTSKIIEGSRSLDSNTGQAGSIDIFKLYNETELSGQDEVFELSRGLIKFDYSDFSSSVDINDPSFRATVVLKSVYGGQTTPSNFTLVLYPLSKSFEEGRGFDIASYKDIDTANFLYCSSGTLWVISGANAKGTPGQNVDVIVSGNFGAGNVDLQSTCSFARGDENGIFDVTSAVSASIAGTMTNNGFRLSFIESQETDNKTRFVKRFASRQALSKELHPKLIIEYDDRVLDTSSKPLFNVTQSFFVYNIINGTYTDFISASSTITTLQLQLISSKSIEYTTQSFQSNFNQTIEHKTSSLVYFSQSFTGSKINNGIYSSSFTFNVTSDLLNYMDGSNQIGFDLYWKDITGVTTFARKFVKFEIPAGGFSNAVEPNYIVNIVNLKQEYSTEQCVRLKVFIQDRTNSVIVSRAMEPMKSVTLSDMRWRLKKAYSKSIVIPFTESTRLSSDAENMYFDIYMNDLDINEVYEIEFLIKNDQGKDIIISRKGFTFKVVQ